MSVSVSVSVSGWEWVKGGECLTVGLSGSERVGV